MDKRGFNTAMTIVVPTVALPVLASVIPGLAADSIVAALCAGVLLGVMQIVLKPLLKLLTLPLGCLTLGLMTFVIDVGLVYGADFILGGFHVESLQGAVFTALALSFLTTLFRRRRG